MKNTEEKKAITDSENFNGNSAYEIPVTPRYDAKSLHDPYKTIQKSKNSALQPKSFTLERSIQKINVMQARNYLKKPDQIKPFSPNVSSIKKLKNVNQPKINKSEAFIEFDNLEDVFEEKTTSKVKKMQALRPIKTKSYKLCKSILFINKDYADTTQ